MFGFYYFENMITLHIDHTFFIHKFQFGIKLQILPGPENKSDKDGSVMVMLTGVR